MDDARERPHGNDGIMMRFAEEDFTLRPLRPIEEWRIRALFDFLDEHPEIMEAIRAHGQRQESA